MTITERYEAKKTSDACEGIAVEAGAAYARAIRTAHPDFNDQFYASPTAAADLRAAHKAAYVAGTPVGDDTTYAAYVAMEDASSAARTARVAASR